MDAEAPNGASFPPLVLWVFADQARIGEAKMIDRPVNSIGRSRSGEWNES